jgi:pSer/pThr/pTyr-binding forkhead associated (FHA) protein
MQSGADFRLTVRRGPQPNQQYPLTRDTITIGRDITNDVVVNDPEVSRHHARLIRTASGYTLEDLRSTNGTFVNRQRLASPYQLSDGDLVGLGETVTLVYEVIAGAQAATVIGAGREAPRAPAAAPPPPGRPAYQAPPPPPISEPIADEEEFEPDRNRWIVIGCGVLTLLFCCALVAGLIVIDNYENGILWCEIPILNEQLFNCPP